MGNMLNNTKARVTYPLEEIIKIAFHQLAKEGLVPYTHPNVPIEYSSQYHVKNGEGKIVNNTAEVTVTFGLAPKAKPEPKKEYEAGDWKDPDVEKLIDRD